VRARENVQREPGFASARLNGTVFRRPKCAAPAAEAKLALAEWRVCVRVNQELVAGCALQPNGVGRQQQWAQGGGSGRRRSCPPL